MKQGFIYAIKTIFQPILAFFLKEKVVLNDKYFEIAPEVAIEVADKIETHKDLDYVFSKSEEIMNFGTERILWLITKHKKYLCFQKMKRHKF
jgi:Uma2 family endonuclease